MAQIRILKKLGREMPNDPESLGIAHLPGSFQCGSETLCGYVDTGNTYHDTRGKITCRGCLDAARAVLLALTETEQKTLKTKTAR